MYHGTPRLAHYVTSKAGIIGFTRVLAQELGDYGIAVNAIAPGLTLSLDDPSEAAVQAQQQRSQIRCFKRIQTTEDLVGAVAFLCSADSDFLTGQTIAWTAAARCTSLARGRPTLAAWCGN